MSSQERPLRPQVVFAPEGGNVAPGTHSAEPLTFNLSGYVSQVSDSEHVNDALRHLSDDQRHYLQNTSSLSTRETASAMRALSSAVWMSRAAEGLWYAAVFWHVDKYSNQLPIQETFNNRLWTPNADGTFNHVTSDDMAPLFDAQDPETWPNLILTSNHARAWSSKDLYTLTDGFQRLAEDAAQKPLDLCRLTNWSNEENPLSKPQAQGKTIMVMACSTEKDTLLNGARLIDRRLDLEEDKKGKQDPADRTLKNISPASMRLAKLMLKCMVEPQCQQEIDLDRSCIDTNPALKAEPFVAHALMAKSREDIYYPENHPIVLRKDAASIARHIKLIGYSMGANTTTDALRFFYQECAQLKTLLKVRGKNGELHDATPDDIKAIISNIALMNIAPGEVPLTEKEKDVVGIRRVSILNTNDMTAGHLVNPHLNAYDPNLDVMIKIEGGRKDAGHSVDESLGRTGPEGHIGFIMNPENTVRNNYQQAQYAVRAFFDGVREQVKGTQEGGQADAILAKRATMAVPSQSGFGK